MLRMSQVQERRLELRTGPALGPGAYLKNGPRSVHRNASLPSLVGFSPNDTHALRPSASFAGLKRPNVFQHMNTFENEVIELRKEIEQANSDALAAHKKYLASNKSVQALSESFSYTQEKYNVEFVSTYEYNDAKNRLFKAESDLLEAKYDYVFKIKILDFYTGNKLTF